ncbi:MAG TPA: four helix bundle protein [Clostridia bacterium]|nr:four helix bundle protein [Clostridia bacterium]
MGKSYRDLLAWQKAMDFAEQVYGATEQFPPRETYGLTSQLRRAAVSVPSNIAEGQGRRTSADFVHFLSNARGSLMEVETQLMLARRLRFVSDERCTDLLNMAGEIGRMLNGLMNSLRAK